MPTFIPGKLKLKGASSSSNGDKKKKKAKRNREDHDESKNTSSDNISSTVTTTTTLDDDTTDPDEFLTETQRKFEQKKRKVELAKAKGAIGVSYRDRVEQFNYDLSVMSEHNDIPRISAAGNG